MNFSSPDVKARYCNQNLLKQARQRKSPAGDLSLYLFLVFYFSRIYISYLKLIGIVEINTLIPLILIGIVAIVLNCRLLSKIQIRFVSFVLIAVILLSTLVLPIVTSQELLGTETIDYVSGFLFVLMWVVLGMLFETHRDARLLRFLYLVCSLGALITILIGTMYPLQYAHTRFGGERVLEISDRLAICSLLIIGQEKGSRRFILGFISALLLILLSSFTSVLLFLMCLLIMQLFVKRNDRFRSIKYSTVLILVIMILIALLLGISTDLDVFFADYLGNFFSRLSNVIEFSDSSLNSRLLQFRVGIEEIVDNPLWGNWKYYVKSFQRSGFYMHNILSWWAEYGIAAFISVLVLSFIQLRSLHRKLSFDDEGNYLGLFLSFLYVFLAMLLSRSFVFRDVWLIMGMSLVENKPLSEKVSHAIVRD